MFTVIARRLSPVALLAAVVCIPAGAVDVDLADAPTALIQPLSVEAVQRRADDVAAATDLSEATKKTLADLYRSAITSLETAASYRNATQKFQLAIESTPREITDLEAKLAARKDTVDDTTSRAIDSSFPELEQQLQRDKAAVVALGARFAEIGDQIGAAEERPTIIRQRLTEAQSQISRLENEKTLLGDTQGETPDLQQARRWAAAARQQLLQAEIQMLEQELAGLPLRLDRLRAQQALVEFELESTTKNTRALEAAANEQRTEEAQRAKTEAEAVELEAASKHPLVADLAARNTRLSEEINRLAGAIETIEQNEEKAAEEAKRLEAALETTQQKIEVAGLSQILGQVLQEQRRTLPDARVFDKEARERERRIADTTLSQILLEEERRQLRDIPTYVASLTESLPEANTAEVSAELQPLVLKRQELVDNALSIQRTYLQAMGELDFSRQRLADVVKGFDAFLDKRLLWVRSTQAAGLDTMRRIPSQVASLLDVEEWRGVVSDLLHEAGSGAWIAFALLIAVTLRINRANLLAALDECGTRVGVIMEDRLQDTVHGLFIIVLLSLPWALVMFAVGRELNTSLDANDFSKHVGSALLITAPLQFQLQALRLFAAPKSIADVHFRWREAGVRRLHVDVSWFTPIMIAIVPLTVLSLDTSGHVWGSGLGRALFVLLMATIAAFFYRLSHPSSGTLGIMFEHHQDSPIMQFRHLWFVLLIGAPIAAAAVALAGFMYTAGTVITHILDTAWFALLVLVIHQMIVRWLLINQRKLRLQALRAKRQAQQEAREAKASADEAEVALAHEIEEPEVDFKALDASSRKLTNNAMLLVGLIGVWLIWQDMLPALGILDDVTLWTYAKAGVEGPVPITLSSIGVALLVLLVMVLATRQLPAFLEIVLLQRLNMTQGGRYTVLTLAKYTIVAVGVAWIFGILGGSWSEIQWVFAALGVGIGFGLQEIVANFISGLIILFERPIRVGDVVTVGNTDGVVTRIRIRATTIRNWDRKELLVPNKNFITQELLNWSLSDQVTRIMVVIGIAYGSDVERALRILEDAAGSHSRVLSDPPPLVVFESFGDNALQLSLRCFIDDIDFRLRTITELNLEINKRMAEAGIEIAFPQRDIHLTARQPLDIHILGERT